MKKTILNAGQCGVDGPRLERMLGQKLEAAVVSADTLDDAIEQLAEREFDLVLVNRVFAADDSSGLDLIRQMKESGDDTPVMLVSDHEDAQAEASELGALEGFGKSELASPATVALLKKAIGD